MTGGTFLLVGLRFRAGWDAWSGWWSGAGFMVPWRVGQRARGVVYATFLLVRADGSWRIANKAYHRRS